MRPVPDHSEPLLRELFGEILRRKRAERGRTLRDIADAAGVSLAYVSEVERGQKEASSEILNAVCGALDITMLDLVRSAHQDLELRRIAAEPARSITTPRADDGAALAMAA